MVLTKIPLPPPPLSASPSWTTWHTYATGMGMIVVGGALAYFGGDSDGTPGSGRAFALAVLFAGAAVLGRLVPYAGLPPLLGMLLAGLLLRNVPGDLIAGFSDDWASLLKAAALSVILLRAGLGLSLPALRAMGGPTLRLAFGPVLFEAGLIGLLAMALLDLPAAWAFLLGFTLSAVSPAVVVPSLLKLQRGGYGVAKGIPTMVLAAASLDDVVAISGFGAFLGIAFAEGSLLLNILRGPIELVAGLVLGAILGIIAIPVRHAPAGWRCVVVSGLGMAATLGGRKFEVTGTGALATVVFGFIVRQTWGEQRVQIVSSTLRSVWVYGAEIILFSLIGAAVDLDVVQADVVGKGILMLAISIVLRAGVTVACVLGTPLNWRERLFMAFAWLPKATVQAALGSIALDTARDRNEGPTAIERGETILTLAVLVILITAPIGALAIAWFGTRWLSNATDPDAQENNKTDEEDPCQRDSTHSPVNLPLAPILAPHPPSAIGDRNARPVMAAITPHRRPSPSQQPHSQQPMMEGTPWYPRSSFAASSGYGPGADQDEDEPDSDYTYTYSE